MLFWFLDMAKLWALRCFSVCACVGEYVWFRIGSNTTCQEYQRLGQSQIMWEVKYTNKPSRSRSLLCLCVSSCPYLLCDWRWRIVMMSSGFGCLRSVLSHNQEVLFWLTPCFWNLPYTFFFLLNLQDTALGLGNWTNWYIIFYFIYILQGRFIYLFTH